MQHAHLLKPPSCERKKPQHLWGTVLGKVMDFLLLQTSCCRLPPAGYAKGGTTQPSTRQLSKKAICLGHIAIGSFSLLACPSARLRCVESKTTDFLQMRSCWHCVLLEALLVGQEAFMGDRRCMHTHPGQERHPLLSSLWYIT